MGSDTETVHLFRCKADASPGSTHSKPWGSGWSSSAPSSPSADSPGMEADDMDRVIEQKRRNGSMG